jgi:hypothetical protein
MKPEARGPGKQKWKPPFSKGKKERKEKRHGMGKTEQGF